MSHTYVSLRVPVEQETRAILALAEAGVDLAGDIFLRDDESRDCWVITYQRAYTSRLIRSLIFPDSMVEYEVRRVGDAWRNQMRKLVVEASAS